MRPTRRVGKQAAVCAVTLVMACGWATVMTGCRREPSLRIGERAPELTSLDLNDKPVKLSDFKGKVVVLRFWSHGCLGCVAEMPAMDDLSKRYKDRGLVVLAVNVADPKEKVEQFVRDRHISYPVVLDPAHIAASKYRVSAVPTTFLIDRNGATQKVVFGRMKEGELERVAGELL